MPQPNTEHDTNLIPNPADYFVNGEVAKGLNGGGNMAAVHLSKAVGGDLFMGFISAVAFATILAVVAGLTLSGASAVSHDLYASVWRHGNVDSATELRVSKITTVCLGIFAVLLGIVFEKENVAFMVMLAFAVACSANFPVLFMSVLWKDCTTKGAVGALRQPGECFGEFEKSRCTCGVVERPVEDRVLGFLVVTAEVVPMRRERDAFLAAVGMAAGKSCDDIP